MAANISAGAQFGFSLLWVIVIANVMAGLVQYLSAKLGLVTGRSLPEAIGGAAEPHRPDWPSGLQAEIVAMATDVAEVIGGAIALHILFGLPLLLGGVITGVVSLLLLRIQDQRGQQLFERVITGLLLVIAIGFTASFFVATPPPGDVLGGLVPRFLGKESVLLAAAILGATVMPHAVYLHSGLARDRHGHPDPGPDRRRLLRDHPVGRRAGDGRRRGGERRHAAGRCAEHAGPRRHRFHRGGLRRRARHREPD